MKHLLRLYPAWWRERYWEEFEALLEQRPLRWRDAVDIARGGIDARVHQRPRNQGTTQQRRIAMVVDRNELRDELRAILAAREELGEESEEHLLESFLDRLEESVRPAGLQPPLQKGRPTARTLWRWTVGVTVLWLLLGLSSIAVGIPWSLGSTAPAQVFAAAVVSGYALVLVVLLCAFLLSSALRTMSALIRHSSRVGTSAHG